MTTPFLVTLLIKRWWQSLILVFSFLFPRLCWQHMSAKGVLWEGEVIFDCCVPFDKVYLRVACL